MPKQSKPRWVAARRHWRLRFGGRDYYKTDIGEADEAAAWSWATSIMDPSSRPVPAATPKAAVETPRIVVTFKVLVDLYLAHVKRRVAARKVSATEYPNARRHLGLLCAHKSGGRQTAARPVETYTAAAHAAFLESMEGAEYSPNYRRNVNKTVQAMLNWAAKPMDGRKPERLIAANPIAGAPKPKVPKRDPYVDPPDVRRFLRWCWAYGRRLDASRRKDLHHAVLAIRFMWMTGCRTKEVCELLWTDIDWEEGMATIPFDRHKTGRSTGKARTIYLTPESARLLKLIGARSMRRDRHVFGHRRGHWNTTALDQKFRILRGKAKDAGIPVSEKLVPYAARHVYCTTMLDRGVTYRDLGHIVGNSAETLERYYDHVRTRHLRDVTLKASRRGKAG